MKTMKKYIFMTAWVLLLVPGMAVAQGNLVSNGGFDSNADGWTIINVSGGFGYSTAGGNPGGDVLLDNLTPSPSSTPTASQTISGLDPGTAYVVSGDYQQAKNRGGGSSTDPSFGVAIDGLYLFTTAAPGNYSWQTFSFSYTAASSSTVLSLSSQLNGTGMSYAIDNISFKSVPEPGITGLFGIGVLMLCRRRPRPDKLPE
jgi:hypothetical protein